MLSAKLVRLANCLAHCKEDKILTGFLLHRCFAGNLPVVFLLNMRFDLQQVISLTYGHVKISPRSKLKLIVDPTHTHTLLFHKMFSVIGRPNTQQGFWVGQVGKCRFLLVQAAIILLNGKLIRFPGCPASGIWSPTPHLMPLPLQKVTESIQSAKGFCCI